MRRFAISLLAAGAVTVPLRAQWTPQESGTNAEFRGLVALSPTVVWASGTRGRVARTTDGGRTWHVDSVPGAAALDLRAIAARGETTAWAISAGPAEQGQAQVYHTTDGARWTKQYAITLTGVFLDAIAFWDDRHGIALSDPVAGRLFVLVTDDGGAHWEPAPTDS